MPAQPETIQERGFGPFVTFVVRKRPDGVIAHWESRDHRKHLHPDARRGSTWWAPHDRDWWIAVLFAVGSILLLLLICVGLAALAFGLSSLIRWS